jgi:hypothetical protein
MPIFRVGKRRVSAHSAGVSGNTVPPFIDPAELSMPRNLQTDIAAPLAGAMASSLLRTMRERRGYSLEELSFTCGLATRELAAIESGSDADPATLRRIATALQLPESAFVAGDFPPLWTQVR